MLPDVGALTAGDPTAGETAPDEGRTKPRIAKFPCQAVRATTRKQERPILITFRQPTHRPSETHGTHIAPARHDLRLYQ